jgi:transcriptional regulator with XRE-family HTH domain
MPENLNIVDARKALQRRKEQSGPRLPVPRDRDLFSSATQEIVPAAEHRPVSLLETTPAPLPLNAYLASALTGLNDSERNLIFGISDLVSQVCEEHGIGLYEPRKRTDPVLHADVSAPDVYAWDKQSVLQSDLLVHLCHHPSTGAGEELEFAQAALLPIILIHPADLKVSRMVLGIPSLVLKVAYKTVEDLQAELNEVLFNFRPLLEERKLARSQYDKIIVGEKVRELRERLGLTRAEIAKSSPHLTEEVQKNIEEKTDRQSNPSLAVLREIATVLKTTVSELVEPDFNQRVLVMLNAWVADRAAARSSISKGDRNKAIRAVLRRLADSLDDD